MVLNPDVVLRPDFLAKAMVAFDDPRVGAVTGKTLKSERQRVIDSTGITINRARRGRDRGQGEVDRGQYDGESWVFGCTGAAAIYRRTALEDAKVPRIDLSGPPKADTLPMSGEGNNERAFEYFDEDFFAYWEDMDLSWRLRLAGWECRFVPQAVALHPRKAGASPGGYQHLISFIRHHRSLPLRIRRWNWRNHLFCIIKNDFGKPLMRDLSFVIARELAMLGYILLFEPSTLGVVPEFFRLLPKMRHKRHYILSHKKVSAAQAAKWFV